MNSSIKASVLAMALAAAFSVTAQTVEGLKAAAGKALDNQPEISAKFNAYRGAVEAAQVVRGGLLPRVDLSGDLGRTQDRINGVNGTLNRTGLALTVTQLLWDGASTSADLSRLGHEKMARYFDLVDASESSALEASRAYYDVLRYRRLVELAEDNYVQHRYAAQQIQSRFKAGVGRGVDLEQANARLALAESNLTTEVANLHDVSARYQRIVGEAPAKTMPLPAPLLQGLPATAEDAMQLATRQSPAISATIETLRAARDGAKLRDSAFQPKVEARLRAGGGHNFDGVAGQSRDTNGEIVLNWNLYNGGSDQARVRQQARFIDQAADNRDKICRDTRQTTAIAYNDVRKLSEQVQLLDRNTLAIAKARDAYRQQFDIGQRSLLDLLNAENELYTARRALANAEFDLGLASVRTHAAMSQLGSTLGLRRPETNEDTQNWAAGEDAPARCPIFDTAVNTTPRAVLDQRVQTAAISAPVAAPAAVASAPLAAKPAAVPVVVSDVPAARLRDWAAAWESKDLARHLSFYAPGFAPTKGSVDAWKANRARMLSKKGDISVKLDQIQSKPGVDGAVDTWFRQTYNSSNFNDVSNKTLSWKNINGQWLVVKESNR
jgi:adhesin transport system outer membrane protein